ncbi:MAG: hypothetical protein NT019_01405 [Candidatus Adlerbacteria bacterium]|nr:hypothetical protein [Candidatus Adlerbacteria bacterium]
MKVPKYFPSTQFSVIFGSILLSVGLVFAANAFTTHAPAPTITVAQTPHAGTTDPNWQTTLDTVQAESGTNLPTPADQNDVNNLLQAAQSSNITDRLSRTLLVNLSNAKTQGLGDDIPTQNELINGALAQIGTTQPTKQYSEADITATDNSPTSLHDYGNALMTVFKKNANGEFLKTLAIIDTVTATNDPIQFKEFPAIQKKYAVFIKGMLAIDVPKTLLPFHLGLLNDFAKMIATYADMQTVLSDPLRGLSGIQQYNSFAQDGGKMFINIAQALGKNGILFTKDEPGASWALFGTPQ